MDSITSEKLALLPIPPENEIFREALIRHIQEMFNKDRTKILIEGQGSSGKTVLLSQFVRYHAEKSISYFIKDNHWSSSLSYFLLELCLQMQQLPAISAMFTNQISHDSLHEEHLIKQLFYRMYRELLAHVKRTGDGPYYFVIDGLDKIKNTHGEENILNHLPADDPAGIFLLVSSNGRLENHLKADVVPIQNFSREETIQYFEGVLDKDSVRQLYDVSKGMTGYLSDIMKSLKRADTTQYQGILTNLPNNYTKLIEEAWSQIDLQNTVVCNSLSVIIASPEPLTLSTLSEIVDIDISTIEIILSNVGFIEIAEETKLIEINSTYKTHVPQTITESSYSATQMMIKYYEKKQVEDSALFLPSLYIRNNNYESLVKLINVENLTKILGSQRNVSTIRKITRSLSEMAYKREDNQRLFWGALTEAFFNELVSNPPAVENQINALLSQDNFETAIQLAYSCILPEDRLMLFSKIGNEMIIKEQPIPIEIIKTLEESVELIDNTVELTENLADKLLDICADLITVQTSLALKLIEKIAEKKGTSNYKNQLMDILLTNVLIKAGPDDSTAEKIQSQISNDSLNNFAKAASSVLEKITVEELYKKVEQIKDVSAKVYLLQSWCNMNRESHHLSEVIAYSLNLMKHSDDYSPTQLQLRKLAQCLLPNLEIHDEVKLKQLVDVFDQYKETIIKHPIDENARLELVLALIIKKWSSEEAMSRYYDVYFKIDKINDMDIRCFVIVRLLLTLKSLAPDDKALEKEFVSELNHFFKNLLNTSADHLEITKKLISALTQYDHELAFSFASKLNREKRRDYAYGEVLRAYTSDKLTEHSVDFIFNTLDQIQNTSYRDWVFVQIIKRFTKSRNNMNYNEKLNYLNRTFTIQDLIGRSYALSYFIVWIYENDPEKAIDLFESLKQSYMMIDSLWEQVTCGFKISSILAKTNRTMSIEIFNLAEEQKNSSVFADERIANLYIETCKIIIRIVPDILHSKEINERITFCIKAIFHIPSLIERNLLLSSLALKCLTYNKRELFNDISSKILVEIETCNDELTLHQVIINSAPLLYEVERNVLYDKIDLLPSYLKDGALDEVLKYLFTRRIPIDPVNISNYPTKLTFPDALKVIEVLEHVQMDVILHCYLEKLIDSITFRKDNKLKTNFNERQVLTIAEKLLNIVSSKLPDPHNITHDGYKIACRISINKLKESLRNSNSFRANSRWDPFNLSWDEIKKEIAKIPNLSDKVFLQANAAADSFFSDKSFSELIIASAEKNLENITNSVDRADRFHLVAKSYHQISNERAAKFLLEESVKQSNAFSSQETRDQLLGGAVELAHTIDPHFASELATNIDSPMFISKSRENILALNLRNDPSKLDLSHRDEYLPVISSACDKILNSLYSGRGVAQHESIIAKWMYCCLGYEFDTTSSIAVWYVENSILSRNKSLSTSKLEALYSQTLQLLEMISNMGQVINNISATNSESFTLLGNVAPKMQTFTLGEKNKAMDFLKVWLSENATEYVKIYDAYFSSTDLEILKYVPQTVDVKILCSLKQKDLDLSRIQESYRSEWRNICDQTPPETLVYLFSTPSGRTPQHDRFIVTDKAGLVLGTSLNGLGSRDTVINVIDNEEKIKIEKEIIDALIINPPRHINEERLLIRTFTFEA